MILPSVPTAAGLFSFEGFSVLTVPYARVFLPLEIHAAVVLLMNVREKSRVGLQGGGCLIC